MGRHFRDEHRETAGDPARRMFLKRSLAAAGGLLSFSLFEVLDSEKPGPGYGSSSYGGKS